MTPFISSRQWKVTHLHGSCISSDFTVAENHWFSCLPYFYLVTLFGYSLCSCLKLLNQGVALVTPVFFGSNTVVCELVFSHET